jgi:hypothetical protein
MKVENILEAFKVPSILEAFKLGFQQNLIILCWTCHMACAVQVALEQIHIQEAAVEAARKKAADAGMSKEWPMGCVQPPQNLASKRPSPPL